MDIINQFYREQYDAVPAHEKDPSGYRGHRYVVVPRCEFNDGYHVSIQAGDGKYSTPRITDYPEYDAFELGFPSAPDDLLTEYAEDAKRPTDTVYGYVPVRVLLALCEKHGGIKGAYVYPDEPARAALATEG